MELRVLRYYLTVVNERNISKAAEKLHVSQPTISRQLKDLEDELGVTLFQRGSRTISLTQAGDYLAHQAQQILALADKTAANVQTTQQISGSIAIGCAEAPMMATIAKAVRLLAQEAPEVRVNFYSADANDTRQRIQAGLFDFGVVMEPSDKAGYHFVNLPGTTDWGVLVPRDTELAQKSVVTAQDLADERLIVPQQQGSVNLLSDWLGTDIKLKVVASYNLLYNASIMVANHVGVALCLDGIINTTDTNLTFIPLAPHLESHTSLIWPQDSQQSPAATTFLKMIQRILPGSASELV